MSARSPSKTDPAEPLLREGTDLAFALLTRRPGDLERRFVPRCPPTAAMLAGVLTTNRTFRTAGGAA